MENIENSSQQLEKLLSIEKKISYNAGLKVGFLGGFIAVFFLILIVSSVAFVFRKPLQKKFMNTVVSSAAEQVFSSFPDGYFTHNREHVMKALDDFTNAAADHKLSKEDYSRIARIVVQDLQDRQLSYQELTDLVNEISRIANKR